MNNVYIYIFTLIISLIIITILIICISKTSINNTPMDEASSIDDPLIKTFATKMLNLNNIIILKNGHNPIIKKNNTVMYFYTNYHNYDGYKISKFIESDRQKYSDTILFILDGEPNDLSMFNMKEQDILIAAKTDKKLLPKKLSNYVFHYSYLNMYLEFRAPNLNLESCLLKNITTDINKPEFCIFVYSNCDEKYDGVVKRKEFLKKLQTMSNGRVDNMGNCYPEIKSNKQLKKITSNQFNDNIFKPYKFVIAFENSKIQGYNTEKIINPILAGAIPIYYGDISVKYINKKRLICVEDYDTIEDCINYVLEVDRNDKLFKEITSQPFFIEDKIPEEIKFKQFGKNFLNMNRNYLQFFKINHYYNKKVVFLTFADQQIYKYDRILSEAKDSNFFTECIGKSLKDLDKDFVNKHSEWISRNKRGYGYWVWKPYNIYTEMDKLNEGDIIFWSDSGCKIIPERCDKVIEYINIVNNSPDGILGFQIKYNSIDWTKKDLIVKLIPKEKLESFEKKKQVTSNLLIIRKTQNSLKIIKEWADIMSEDYHNIDDSPSILKNYPSFSEHRHDQSVLDCLFHKYSLPESLDNYEDDYNKIDNLCKGVIIPLRIK